MLAKPDKLVKSNVNAWNLKSELVSAFGAPFIRSDRWTNESDILAFEPSEQLCANDERQAGRPPKKRSMGTYCLGCVKVPDWVVIWSRLAVDCSQMQMTQKKFDIFYWAFYKRHNKPQGMTSDRAELQPRNPTTTKTESSKRNHDGAVFVH